MNYVETAALAVPAERSSPALFSLGVPHVSPPLRDMRLPLRRTSAEHNHWLHSPAKIEKHASSLRPRTLRGRAKASRLRACCLPSQGGHGAHSCFRTYSHGKSAAARPFP